MGYRRLELGSGHQPWRTDNPEWEHADLNPNAPHVEYLCDVSQPLPFEDNTFAELRAVDIYEHCSYRDSLTVLTEWARILTPKGRIFIQCPDAQTIMQQFLGKARHKEPEFADLPDIVSLSWKLLGGHRDGDYAREGDDWKLNTHLSLWSMDSLRWYVHEAGLEIDSIGRNAFPNLQVWASKP